MDFGCSLVSADTTRRALMSQSERTLFADGIFSERTGKMYIITTCCYAVIGALEGRVG